MKDCFCKACQSCEEIPKNCRIKPINATVFRLIDYATNTQKELNNSLNKEIERI